MSADDQNPGDTGAPGRSNVNAAWDDVGARFADLGRVLKERQRQRAGDDQAGQAAPGEESLGGQPPESPTGEGQTGEGQKGEGQKGEGQKGGGPAREVIEAIDDAFTALGDAVRDPAFQQQARGTLDAFGSALGVTFTELGDHLRSRFERRDEGPRG